MGRHNVKLPWSFVTCDSIEFSASKTGNKYFIVFEDLHTMWVEPKPVRRADGKTWARTFKEIILSRWEKPEYYVTHNVYEVVNKTVREALETYGVKHSHIPPHHVQGP